MAASILKIYSFLCVFNYMFLKEKYEKKICFTIVKFNVFNPFVSSAGEECLGIGFRFKPLNQLRCKWSIFVNMT